MLARRLWIVQDALVRVLVCLCLLVGVASADKGRSVRGYVDGEPTRIRVVDVDGHDVEIKTARAFRKMQDAARKDGVRLHIRSGFRSQKKQKSLWQLFRRGDGHLAARPGFSNHQSGKALDIVIDDRTFGWLVDHAPRFGFHRTVRGEAWHWEFSGMPATARASSKRHRS